MDELNLYSSADEASDDADSAWSSQEASANEEEIEDREPVEAVKSPAGRPRKRKAQVIPGLQVEFISSPKASRDGRPSVQAILEGISIQSFICVILFRRNFYVQMERQRWNISLDLC